MFIYQARVLLYLAGLSLEIPTDSRSVGRACESRLAMCFSNIERLFSSWVSTLSVLLRIAVKDRESYCNVLC